MANVAVSFNGGFNWTNPQNPPPSKSQCGCEKCGAPLNASGACSHCGSIAQPIHRSKVSVPFGKKVLAVTMLVALFCVGHWTYRWLTQPKQENTRFVVLRLARAVPSPLPEAVEPPRPPAEEPVDAVRAVDEMSTPQAVEQPRQVVTRTVTYPSYSQPVQPVFVSYPQCSSSPACNHGVVASGMPIYVTSSYRVHPASHCVRPVHHQHHQPAKPKPAPKPPKHPKKGVRA